MSKEKPVLDFHVRFYDASDFDIASVTRHKEPRVDVNIYGGSEAFEILSAALDEQ